MTEQKGFTIELSSTFDHWWRYNVALMCGCFDAQGACIDFVSTEDRIADVGSNLKIIPSDVLKHRPIGLHTAPCDNITLYIYIVPHTLPDTRSIYGCNSFKVNVSISYDGRKIESKTYSINQWSGASIELKNIVKNSVEKEP